MKLGVASICMLDLPLGSVIETAAAYGLDGIEITGRRSHLGPDASLDDARAAGEQVRAAGMEVLAFGSYVGRRDLQRDEDVRRAVAMTVALRAPLLRVWAEPFPGQPDDLTPVVALLQRAADEAARHDITIVVERHAGSLADTVDRIEDLLRAVDRPNVGLNYQPLDDIHVEDAAREPADCARLVRHARYVHVKNYGADGVAGRVRPFASIAGGVLDWHAILAAALAAGYDGAASIEFVDSAGERPAQEKLRDDVAFLRRVLDEIHPVPRQ